MADRGFIVLRTMNDARHYFMLSKDVADGKFTITAGGSEPHTETLAYSRPDADHLVVEGTFEHESLVVKLKKFDASRYALVSRGFHWVQE